MQLRTRPGGNTRGHGGCARRRLVDLLAGLRGDHKRGTGAGDCLPFKFVSAGQTTGGIDENGFCFVRVGFRQADFGAALLKQFVQPAAPFNCLGYNASSATGALLPDRLSVFATGRADGLLLLLHAVSEAVAEAGLALATQSFLTTASTTS